MAEADASQPNDNELEPEASSAAVDDATSAVEPQQDEAAALRAQLDDANDRALRAQAELENYRKRVRRELEDERRYAALPLIREMLAVVDNLERAIEAAEKSDSVDGLLEGVKMVSQQLGGVLSQHNCNRIEAVGAAFDPNLHEALGSQPSAEHEPGTVIFETRAGYVLHDRVVRPSQVFVAAPPPEAETEADSD